MFKIENGRLSFYQWDTNQRLIIEDASISEVHFCNRTSDCSLVCEVYEEGNKRLVDVPNILLQDDWTIRVYAYCANYTKVEEKFIVYSRSKPADYIYTETEVKSLGALEQKVNDIEESLEEVRQAVSAGAGFTVSDDGLGNVLFMSSFGELQMKDDGNGNITMGV